MTHAPEYGIGIKLMASISGACHWLKADHPEMSAFSGHLTLMAVTPFNPP